MTNWSFEHVADTRAALRTIVSDPAYGATALSNVRIMSEVLPQLLRGGRLERSVLVTAAKESLASTMLEHVADGMDPSTAVRLGANFLNAISHVPLNACFWAAAELALALGLITAEQADALGSGEGAAAAPAGSADVRPVPLPDTIGGPPQESGWTAVAPPADDADDDEAGDEPGQDDDDGRRTRDGDDHWASRGDEQKTDVYGPPGHSAGGYGGGGCAEPGIQAPAGPAGIQAPAGPQPGHPATGQPWGARPIQQPGGQNWWVQPGAPPTQVAQRPQTGGPSFAGPSGPSGPEHQVALAGPDDWVSRAVRDAVRPGLLAFNPPSEMSQGHSDRIEVAVARSPELRDALTSGFRGRGLPEVMQVNAAPMMGVELRGASFQIDALSPVEQLVVPLARWEFDVTPVRAGNQTLTLCVTIRIDPPGGGGGRIAVPVLERDIRIRVDVVYGTRRFVANNWQWLVGTAIGLGGGIAAWVSLVH